MDDVHESPTLQLLECVRKHLVYGIKVYDPYVHKNIVENQYQNFDLVVIMVGHELVISDADKLEAKAVLDARNIRDIHGAYKL